VNDWFIAAALLGSYGLTIYLHVRLERRWKRQRNGQRVINRMILKRMFGPKK